MVDTPCHALVNKFIASQTNPSPLNPLYAWCPQEIVVQRVFSMYNTYLTPVQLTQLTAPVQQQPPPAVVRGDADHDCMLIRVRVRVRASRDLAAKFHKQLNMQGCCRPVIRVRVRCGNTFGL